MLFIFTLYHNTKSIHTTSILPVQYINDSSSQGCTGTSHDNNVIPISCCNNMIIITNIINAIQSKWCTKINVVIESRTVADSIKINYRTTCDTFSQLIQIRT